MTKTKSHGGAMMYFQSVLTCPVDGWRQSQWEWESLL